MQLTALQIRLFRGAALSILNLLIFTHKAQTQEFLRRYSGYSDELVHDGLMLLKEAGWVVETGRYKWGLIEEGQQMILGETPELPDAEEASHEETATPDNEAPAQEQDIPKSQKSDSSDNIGANPSSSSRFQNLDSRKNLLLPLEAASSDKIGANWTENIRNLAERGIREPARSRLANLAHVTPALIEYHCVHAPNLGLAIYRIEHDWPYERAPVEPAPEEELAEECEPDEEAERIWTAALAHLAQTVPKAKLENYIRSASALHFDGQALTLGACNGVVREELERYGRQVSEAVSLAAGKTLAIIIG